MSKKLLDLRKEFSPMGEFQGMYLKIDISLIMKGVLQSLSAPQIKVLLVIAAHMNEEGKGIRKKNKYYFDIDGVETLAANEEDNTQSNKLNTRDVLIMFLDEYKEEFGIEYKPVWGRDLVLS